MARILIIDDEENILRSLKSALERRGHEVVTAENLKKGREFTRAGFDIVLLDIMLPDGNGLEFLKDLLARDSNQAVVMISGHADIDMAVEAIRAGAVDFIEKPLSLDRVLITVNNAAQRNRLLQEREQLAAKLYGEFIGESKAMRKLKEDILRSAPRARRFLIQGENGTGKELVAHMIHRHSAGASGTFVAVNCAALPKDLVEAELFGHGAGAFTGAAKSRKGRFLEADGGTIFLDEISEMPMEAQSKILRVIETGEITPLGSDTPRKIDCLLIAASNRDLETLAGSGKFREDLFFRLNVVRFTIPPLKDRTADIPLLATYFLDRFARESGNKTKSLSPGAEELLKAYDFPGNVRELKNLMERLNIFCEKDSIDADILQTYLPRAITPEKSLKAALEKYEQEYISASLAHNRGNVTETSRRLGLERSHLYKKMRKYGLK